MVHLRFRIMSQTLMAGCDSSRCLEKVRLQKVLNSHTVQLYGRLKRTLIPPETVGREKAASQSSALQFGWKQKWQKVLCGNSLVQIG